MLMEWASVLAALARNKFASTLIALQIAVTLAVLSNALFIIERRLAVSARSTGTDEVNIFTIGNQWVGDPPDLLSRVQTDLAALRSLPGVVDAYVTNSVPLSNSGAT